MNTEARVGSVPPKAESSLSYREAVTEALLEEMERDPDVYMIGEDIAIGGGAFGAIWTEQGSGFSTFRKWIFGDGRGLCPVRSSSSCRNAVC